MFSTVQTNYTNKDTLNNILATKQFVVTMVTEALAEQMNQTSKPIPYSESEFELAGLTPIPTILQYIGPVFVLAFYALKTKTWPVLGEYLALIFALAGTFLLVTHGSTESLVISDQALFWGLLSALALAFYTIQPVGLLRSFSPAAITGWGMLVGGIVLSIWTQPWSFSGTWDGETWLAFGYIVIFGTVLAFYFFLTSVSKIGATFASLLCSVEPLAATLTAVLWLGVSFSGYDWAGTLLILSTVALLTLSKEKAKK